MSTQVFARGGHAVRVTLHDDAAGLAFMTPTPDVRAAFDRVVLAMLAHRVELPGLLQDLLRADPDCVMGHAVAGLQQMLLARSEARQVSGGHLAAAREAMRRRGATSRERHFVSALAAWQECGEMEVAADRLESQLAAVPLDAAALKLSHAIRFMLGDAAAMRLAIERALPAWRGEHRAAFPFVLGCHAFALEETGDHPAAERIGREAVERDPADVWGAHAVAHVLETDGRARDGLRWLAAAERHRAEIGGFARHLSWHAALCHLHLGDGDAALALYDRCIRDEPSEEYRDVANAASLLWRLEAQRVPVGAARWDELADIAERRIGDHSLAFADLHHVLSLAATGRKCALEAFLAGMRGRALRDVDSQARVIASVGLLVAQAVAAALGDDPGEATDLLQALGAGLQRLGGSHAQRDLLARIGLDAALAARDLDAAEAQFDERLALRRAGAWETACSRRLESLRQSGRPPSRGRAMGLSDIIMVARV
ncbi:tetratricopeptide repeat protein [Falsiroseomonas sp. HW251]|uniref:tetratricopeptide repeat protein n=1 Tax=Falsiroseomonas sp. HW251 TaxID=3390998 RepID=UPI003D315EEB